MMAWQGGLRCAALGVAMLAAAGCHSLAATCSTSSAYQQAKSIPPLKVPAGMNRPDTSGALKIPVLKGPTQPRPPDTPCLDSPPPFNTHAPAAPSPSHSHS